MLDWLVHEYILQGLPYKNIQSICVYICTFCIRQYTWIIILHINIFLGLNSGSFYINIIHKYIQYQNMKNIRKSAKQSGIIRKLRYI